MWTIKFRSTVDMVDHVFMCDLWSVLCLMSVVINLGLSGKGPVLTFRMCCCFALRHGGFLALKFCFCGAV